MRKHEIAPCPVRSALLHSGEAGRLTLDYRNIAPEKSTVRHNDMSMRNRSGLSCLGPDVRGLLFSKGPQGN